MIFDDSFDDLSHRVRLHFAPKPRLIHRMSPSASVQAEFAPRCGARAFTLSQMVDARVGSNGWAGVSVVLGRV
ncbi:MAG: hypothetical protein QOI43_2920 [Gaiellales bacterium]|jgi:hypothetical protein|nr:hypothetical protein [Gaiellales bacterium]